MSIAVMTDAFLTVNSAPISWKQALGYLEASDQLGQLIGEVLRHHVLKQEVAHRLNLTVDSEDIEAAIAQFQQAHQLMDENSFEQWLAESGLDRESLTARLAFKLKVEKLRAEVTQPKLQEYFIERKLWLDQVVLSRIVVKAQDLAEELHSQIAEGAVFEHLAREYSITADRWLNGMMGAIGRAELSDSLRAYIDEAQPGALVGPIAVEEGWALFRVEAVLPATFEHPEVQAQLRRELFEQWLAQKIQQLEVQLHLDS